MRKKVVALAVAGVFAAPAAVLAQSSTVQVYGRITYEYTYVDQGNGRPSTDYADTPGGSSIGFRGEEKLGGGLSAWFQCENSVDVRGYDGNDASAANGWCTRNSAVGFKGAWGNLHFGRWDSPFKRALGQGSVGAVGETGGLGTSFVAWGGSGGTNAAAKSTRQRWKRRDAGWTYYESPKFSGFQVLAGFTPGNGAVDNGVTSNTNNDKPRLLSIGGLYSMGPIAVGAGYEEHKDFGTSTSTSSQNDSAWSISGAYTFGGKIEVGATYLDAEYETGTTTKTKRKSWTIGVDWAVAGPHGVHIFYAQADDAKGTSCVGSPGGCSNTGAAGSVGDIPAPGSNTGAKDWSIGYSYKFSKRTKLQLAYHVTDNDQNAFYKNGAANAPLTGGDKQTAFGFHISHSF